MPEQFMKHFSTLFNLDNGKIFCLQVQSYVSNRRKRPTHIAAMRCVACRPDAALKIEACSVHGEDK